MPDPGGWDRTITEEKGQMVVGSVPSLKALRRSSVTAVAQATVSDRTR